MNELIQQAQDSLSAVEIPVAVDAVPQDVFTYFVEGNPLYMAILSLLLILLLLTAWKSPWKVKEVGLTALTLGIIFSLISLVQMADTIKAFGYVGGAVIGGGISASMHSVIFGLIIYLISLIIRLIQKPRL